ASIGTATGSDTYATTSTTVAPGIDEVQSITVSGAAGTYTLTFNGQTTAPLSTSATALQVQAALNALSSVSGPNGNVTVNQVGNVYTVTFGGKLAGTNLPQLIAPPPGGTVATVATLMDGDGTALELKTPNALFAGGLTTGLNVWYEQLVVNTLGSATFGDLPLAVINNDNMWHGPVSL